MPLSLLSTLIRPSQLIVAGEGVEGIQGIEGIDELREVCFPPETESAYVSMVSLSQV